MRCIFSEGVSTSNLLSIRRVGAEQARHILKCFRTGPLVWLFSIAALPLLRTTKAWESLGGGGCGERSGSSRQMLAIAASVSVDRVPEDERIGSGMERMFSRRHAGCVLEPERLR